MKKRHEKMTAAELREVTKEYDRELPVGPDGLPGRPMNSIERRKWRKVRTRMGRPQIGNGVKRVMVSLEADLLKQSDRFAKEHGLSRSKMTSAGVPKFMAGCMRDDVCLEDDRRGD